MQPGLNALRQPVRTTLVAALAAALAMAGAAMSPAWAQDESGWVLLGLAGEEIAAIAADPADPDLLFAGGGDGNGVFRSTDGGASWTPVSTGLGGVQRVGTLAIEPPAPTLGPVTPTVLIGVLQAGGPNLYRSSDLGDSWMDSSTDLPSTTAEVTSIVFNPADPLIAIAALNDGGVAVSGDGGVTWRDESTGLGTDCGASPCVLDLVLDSSTPSTLYAALPADDDVYKTTNAAASWSPTGAGLAAEEIAMHPSDSQTLLVSASLGGLVQTIDGGTTWDDLAGNPGLPAGASHRAVALGPQPSAAWLVADGGADERVYRSLDGGATWTLADAGLEGLTVHSLAVIGGNLVAATDDGVYRFGDAIFGDGFETGDTTAWSSTVP